MLKFHNHYWKLRTTIFESAAICQAKADLHAKNRLRCRVVKNASLNHGCHGQVRLQCIAVGRAGRVGGDVCAVNPVIFQ